MPAITGPSDAKSVMSPSRHSAPSMGSSIFRSSADLVSVIEETVDCGASYRPHTCVLRMCMVASGNWINQQIDKRKIGIRGNGPQFDIQYPASRFRSYPASRWRLPGSTPRSRAMTGHLAEQEKDARVARAAGVS